MRFTAIFLFQVSLFAQAIGSIQTVAGNGAAAFSGDGAAAVSAALNVPVDVFADRAGNLFIADQFNHRIRKVAPNGTITTIAGTGAMGYSGDGGPALSAQLATPTGICGDASGNLYIADVGNQRIRKVDSAGVITTIAGNGAKAYSGDGGPAVNASFFNAVRVAFDATTGSLLIADQSNHRIRKVGPDGVVTTAGGNGSSGFSGDGGPAVSAALNNPTALAIDSRGVIYFSDQFNHRVRKIATDGVITTVAGTGAAGFSGDGGPATSASLNFPGGIAVDAAGNLYLNDDINYRTRRISAAGIITTIAGSGSQGFSGDGGAATAASLNGNFGVSLDLLGNLYIADSTNNRIREVYAAVAGAAPSISAAGFTNGASFAAGGSPGAIATLFGTNLTRNLTGILQSGGIPLPFAFAGTTVSVAGRPAPIFNAASVNGQEQISFQIPVDAPTGQSVPVVLNNGVGSATAQVTLAPTQPGIFMVSYPSGPAQAAALHADFSLVSPTKPAAQGETIIVFCTGLGAVNPPVATGAVALGGANLPNTVAAYTATIAGQNAPVAFSGLAPGFIALGQVNLTVPTGAPSGLQDIVLTGGGNSSNTVKIQIQ